jgi:hypothetical protein
MPTPGSTEARGYGRQHQKLRALWAPLVSLGQVDCARCGEPLDPAQPWDLGHQDGTDKRRYSGPEHMECNRAAGALVRNGNRVRRSSGPHRPSRRNCEICGTPYRAGYREQRTCGRACGVELQRRNRPPREVRAMVPRTHCSRGHELVGTNVTHVGVNCAGRRCAICYQTRFTESRQRAQRAAAMRAEGMKWQDISDQLGFSGPGAAYQAARASGDPEVVARWAPSRPRRTRSAPWHASPRDTSG